MKYFTDHEANLKIRMLAMEVNSIMKETENDIRNTRRELKLTAVRKQNQIYTRKWQDSKNADETALRLEFENKNHEIGISTDTEQAGEA